MNAHNFTKIAIILQHTRSYIFWALLTLYQEAHSCIQSFLDILKLVNLFCLLDINKFHILQYVLCNSIMTI
jgi:hypothetical protein